MVGADHFFSFRQDKEILNSGQCWVLVNNSRRPVPPAPVEESRGRSRVSGGVLECGPGRDIKTQVVKVAALNQLLVAATRAIHIVTPLHTRPAAGWAAVGIMKLQRCLGPAVFLQSDVIFQA